MFQVNHNNRVVFEAAECKNAFVIEYGEEQVRERGALPQEIALTIKYRTDGARRLTRIKDLGTLVEVREDGVSRAPKSTDTSEALRWLADHGYEPVDRVWLDRPGGLYRRQKSTFRRNGAVALALRD